MNNAPTFWDYFERLGPWIISALALSPQIIPLISQLRKAKSETRKINAEIDNVTSDTWAKFSSEIRSQLEDANTTLARVNKDQEELRTKYNDLLIKYTIQEQTIVVIQGDNKRLSEKVIILEAEKESQKQEILILTSDNNRMSRTIIEQQQKILEIEKKQNKEEG